MRGGGKPIRSEGGMGETPAKPDMTAYVCNTNVGLDLPSKPDHRDGFSSVGGGVEILIMS